MRADGYGRSEHREIRFATRGQVMTEYLILTGLIGLVLVIGQDSPLESLFRTFQGAWGRFTLALSLP